MHCVDCTAFNKSLFKILPKELLDQLMSKKKILSLDKGEYLFKQGSETKNIFCLMNAICKVTQRDEGSTQETIIRFAGPGDITGHRSIFHSDNYLGNSMVLSKGNVCQIPKNDFLKLIHSSPKISLELLKKVSIDMIAAEKRIYTFHKFSVRERLLDILSQLALKYGVHQKDEQYSLTLNLTRSELASLVSASMENIVRTISELKKEDVLSEETNGVFLIDINKINKHINKNKK